MVPSYFYIVKFNGHMYEVKYTSEKIKAVMEAIQNKGWIMIREEQIQTNSSGIEDVMTEDQYLNWIETQRPKQFVRKGIWYYGKDKTVMRVEKWKQAQIDAEKKTSLPPAEKPLTKAQQENIKKIRENIGKKFGVKAPLQTEKKQA
jgi:hypothetical protein